MKIMTLSDTEWGGKPTAYAAVVENEDSEGLAAYITSALEEKWRYGKDAARAVVHGEFMWILKEHGFAWISERILVELTDVDKFLEGPEIRARGCREEQERRLRCQDA